MASTNEYGLIPVLQKVFGQNINVRIPLSIKSCNTSIDDIDFSPRAEHALKRVGVFTVEGVVDLIANEKLINIRNLGKKTQSEIKTRLLLFGYDHLTEQERKRFFYDLVEKNCI